MLPDNLTDDDQDLIGLRRKPWTTPPFVSDGSYSPGSSGLPPATAANSSSLGSSVLGNKSLGQQTDTKAIGQKDLSTRYDEALGRQPHREQFKQPPLATWQKVGLPIAAAATELGGELHGKAGLGSSQLQEGWTYPQARQEDLYQKANKEWQEELGGLENESKIRKNEADIAALDSPESKDPKIMETSVGLVGVNPSTLNAKSVRDEQGNPIGPKPTATERPLTDQEIAQGNAEHSARFQINNPGKPLPDYHTLKSGATSKDYERVNSALNSEEGAQATATQHSIQNKDREEQQGLNWVYGTDPQSKRLVAVPLSEAKDRGLQNMAKVDAADQSKIQAARAFTPLAQRALAVADKLDKEGKMGIVMSRWNDFLAGKVGADPEFAPLRVLNGLGNTLLLQYHVGSRGGSQLLEHFQDLANAGKMNAATFKAALTEELRYANDRAMNPDDTGSSFSDTLTGNKGKTTQGTEEEPTYDINGKRIK